MSAWPKELVEQAPHRGQGRGLQGLPEGHPSTTYSARSSEGEMKELPIIVKADVQVRWEAGETILENSQRRESGYWSSTARWE